MAGVPGRGRMRSSFADYLHGIRPITASARTNTTSFGENGAMSAKDAHSGLRISPYTDKLADKATMVANTRQGYETSTMRTIATCCSCRWPAASASSMRRAMRCNPRPVISSGSRPARPM